MAKRKTSDSSIPKELLKNRGMIECNVVFSLWKDKSIFDDYRSLINVHEDLISDDGKLYFNIMCGVYDLEYEVIDHMAVANFLTGRDEMKAAFNSYGGYHTVVEILDSIQVDNIEGYYDELAKSNMLIRLHRYGFDVLNNLDHYKSLTAEQVYDEFESFISNTCSTNVQTMHDENLSENYEPYIKQWDTGFMKGFPIAYPLLEKRLMGIHKKNLLLHMAHIGNGKTTSAINFYILPAIQSGEDVCIIANEQDVSEFRQMILSTVVCNVMQYRGINRSKFLEGGFNKEQVEKMYEAQSLLSSYDGKIHMIETSDYSIGNVKKIVKKYSKRNCSLFIFDTLKPNVESSEKAWAEFSEVAKQLFLLAKRCDVAIVATAQLSSESMSRRYLDLSCVGKSRAIAETATQVVMFRSVSKSEIENHAIKAFLYEGATSEYEKKTREIPLNVDEDYIVVFTPKNRFGSISPPIIYRRNMDYNSLEEVGYTQVDFDGYASKG